jgi:hypothetical protein
MATISWTAGASGAWSDGSNWTPASAPGAGDDALFDTAGTYRVTVAGATVNRITLDDPVASLVSGDVLTVNEGLIVSAGTVDIVTGTVIAIGTFDNAGNIPRTPARWRCSDTMTRPASSGSAAPAGHCCWRIRWRMPAARSMAPAQASSPFLGSELPRAELSSV